MRGAGGGEQWGRGELLKGGSKLLAHVFLHRATSKKIKSFALLKKTERKKRAKQYH